MADGLLNKASIILTPTGYKAGTLYNVAPVVEPYEDFDFARASVASRVNSSGLVEMVGRTLSSELVQNGDFSELGSELVTNGDFATDSDWTKGTGWSIANGVASSDGSQSSNSSLYQLSVLSQYKTYKFQFTLSNVTNGSVRLRNGIGDSETYISYKNIDGTYTAYAKVNASNTTLVVDADADFIGSIDNVSVKQVDPNDRWTLGTGWSIGDGIATSTTSGSSSYLTQSGILTSSNTYKITFTVSNYVSGTVKATVSGQEGSSITANGTYTEYLTTTGTDFSIKSQGGTFNGSIDNVSVKEIIDTNNIPRISYDSNGQNGHILLEPTSTNLITYSEDLIQIFGGPDFTPTYPYDISPDGTQSSTRLQLSNLGNSRFFYSTSGIVTSGQSYNFSCYYKGTSSQTVYIKALVTGGTDVIKEITLNGNWQREDITFTAGSSTGFVYIVDSREGGTASDFQVWGAQLEALSYATSYIPTLTGSTVTRATETATGAGSATLINSTEGVLYAEIAALADDGLNKRITISDGTLTNRITLTLGNSNISGFINVNNSTQYTFFESITTTDFNKIAIKFKANDFAVWINGVEYDVDTSGSIFSANTLNVINFANATITDNDFYGKVKALAVFNEALNDSELTQLTT